MKKSAPTYYELKTELFIFWLAMLTAYKEDSPMTSLSLLHVLCSIPRDAIRTTRCQQRNVYPCSRRQSISQTSLPPKFLLLPMLTSHPSRARGKIWRTRKAAPERARNHPWRRSPLLSITLVWIKSEFSHFASAAMFITSIIPAQVFLFGLGWIFPLSSLFRQAICENTFSSWNDIKTKKRALLHIDRMNGFLHCGELADSYQSLIKDGGINPLFTHLNQVTWPNFELILTQAGTRTQQEMEWPW